MIGFRRERTRGDASTLWAIICVVTLHISRVAGQCPGQCRCTEREAVCFSLSEVVQLPENLTHVTLSGNNLTSITNTSVSYLSRLEMLDLSNNQIEVIHPDAFQGLYHLENIKLDGNRLKVIQNGTFSNLRLNKLTLNDNPTLSEIEADAFVDTEMLWLEVSGCSLATLHAAVFRDLKVSLQYLTLSLNQRPLELPAAMFRGFTFEQFIFQYDGLSSVDFLSGTAAALVDLTGNRLLGNGVWNITRDMTLLEEVILSDVGMTSVEIQRDGGIEGLDLSNNNIERLEGAEFAHAPSLFSLILTNNRLTEFPADLGQYAPRLIILTLSQNDIGPTIGPEVFNGTALQVLEMQDCRMQTLPEALRLVLRDMRTVKLGGNPLHCNCELRWLNEWARSLRYGDTDLRLGACASPNVTSGVTILELRSDELLCSTPLMVFTAQSTPEMGRPLAVHCKASGEPAPAVTLSRGEGLPALAQQSAGENRTERDTYLQYTLPAFSCPDAGLYRCTAENVAGGVAETLHVPPPSECSPSTPAPLPPTSHPDDVIIVTPRTTTTTSTTTTTATTPTPKTGGSTDDDANNNVDYVLPLVICFVLVLLVGMVITIVVWERRNRRKYDLCKRQREPRIAYINNAMEIDDKVHA